MPQDRPAKKITAAFFLVVASALLCSPYAKAASCVFVGEVCADNTPCKTISGVSVCLAGAAPPAGGVNISDTCWNYRDSYNCASPTQVDDCQPLRDKGCGQIGSTCLTTDSSGNCTMYQQTYQCQTTPASTSTVQDCSVRSFCMNGQCFDTGAPPDSDFAKAVAGMEAAREAGTYMDPNSLQLFKGYDNRCTKGYFGLKNCCKTSGGGAGMSNAGVIGQLAWQGVSNGAGTASAAASPYVYDAMFSSDNSWLMGKAVDAWSASAWSPAFDPSVSLYGVTWTSASTVPSAMIGTNTIIGEAGQTMGGTLYFNPYMLGATVALMVIQDLMSCTQEEQTLGMKRGQNLCHFAGSYCSNKVPILNICLETTESYCCFNSRLARIINEQGRPQLGKGWGSGESPDCSGFTTTQFALLDFSTMDLSEFYTEIMATVQLPDTSALANQTQQKVKQFYQQSGAAQ